MPMNVKVWLILAPLALAASGCFGSKGPSDVSQGKQYTSGNAEYDEFFGAMYQLQVSLGSAPDRERSIRQHLSEALGIDPSSRAEEIGAALSKRVARIGKPGSSVTLTITGLEPKGTPSSVVTTAGTIEDKSIVQAIEQAGKDAATLLGDVRRSSAATEHLRAEAPTLEPAIDDKFRLDGPGKKSDVRKNLTDAERMIPLMSSRAADIEERTVTLLRKLEKSVGSPDSSGPVKAEKVILEETGKPSKAKPKPGGHGEPKAGGHGEPKGAGHAQPKPAEPKPQTGSEETEAPKKPPPKAAPPPADDFEP
jgi:hypothetical protein